MRHSLCSDQETLDDRGSKKLEDDLQTSERLREKQLRKADERHASLLHTVKILTEEVEELRSRRDSTEYPRNPADEPNDSSCEVLTSPAVVSSQSYSTVLAANITVNSELEDSARPESASRGNDDGQERKSPAVDTKRPKPQVVEHEPESEWVKPRKRRRKPSRRMHSVIEPASSLGPAKKGRL